MLPVKEWDSGYHRWLREYPDASMDEKNMMWMSCVGAFDLREFLDYYDGLTDEEWNTVVQEMAELGYDIRCVFAYKKRRGSDFTISILHEIYEPLLAANQVLDLVFWRDLLYFETPMDKEDRKDSVVALYREFGLPIPQYWRDKLW